MAVSSVDPRPDAPLDPSCEDQCGYRALIDELPELICKFTIDGTIVFVNESCADFHGRTPTQLIGRRLVELVPDGFVRHTEDHLAELSRCTPDDPTMVNLTRATERDGSERWQEWTNTAVFRDGAIVEFIGIGRDVTARIEAEEQSRYHAEHDDLTGLLNRRMITQSLDRLGERARRGGSPFGVVYLDVDRFKQINDELGHHVGDKVLIAVADALREVVRVDDVVGRIGGDEFVVLVNPATDDALSSLRRRFVAALDHLDPRVDVSIGSAISTQTTNATALLRLADQAMYADKSPKRPTR